MNVVVQAAAPPPSKIDNEETGQDGIQQWLGTYIARLDRIYQFFIAVYGILGYGTCRKYAGAYGGHGIAEKNTFAYGEVSGEGEKAENEREGKVNNGLLFSYRTSTQRYADDS